MDNCTVKIRKNEDSETLIKRFSRKVKKSGIIEEILERKYHKKRSDRKREERRHREMVIRKLHEKRELEEGDFV